MLGFVGDWFYRIQEATVIHLRTFTELMSLSNFRLLLSSNAVLIRLFVVIILIISNLSKFMECSKSPYTILAMGLSSVSKNVFSMLSDLFVTT